MNEDSTISESVSTACTEQRIVSDTYGIHADPPFMQEVTKDLKEAVKSPCPSSPCSLAAATTSKAVLALQLFRSSPGGTSSTLSALPQKRRLEIASMLDRAAKFAEAVENQANAGSTAKFRHCASTPQMARDDGNARKRARYQRRNSFVIAHTSRDFPLLTSPPPQGSANAIFLPEPKLSPKRPSFPLGLRTAEESNSVLRRMSSKFSATDSEAEQTP